MRKTLLLSRVLFLEGLWPWLSHRFLGFLKERVRAIKDYLYDPFRLSSPACLFGGTAAYRSKKGRRKHWRRKREEGEADRQEDRPTAKGFSGLSHVPCGGAISALPTRGYGAYSPQSIIGGNISTHIHIGRPLPRPITFNNSWWWRSSGWYRLGQFRQANTTEMPLKNLQTFFLFFFSWVADLEIASSASESAWLC